MIVGTNRATWEHGNDDEKECKVQPPDHGEAIPRDVPAGIWVEGRAGAAFWAASNTSATAVRPERVTKASMIPCVVAAVRTAAPSISVARLGAPRASPACIVEAA